MPKLKDGVPGEGQDLSDEGGLTSQSWSSEELCLHLCFFICTVALSLAFSFCLLQPTDLEPKPKGWISCGMFKSSVEGVSDLLEVSFLPYWLNIWFVLFYCGNPVPSTVLTSVTFQHHQHCKICYTKKAPFFRQLLQIVSILNSSWLNLHLIAKRAINSRALKLRSFTKNKMLETRTSLRWGRWKPRGR